MEGCRQELTDYIASYFCMSLCSTIQKYLWPLQILKVLSSATASVRFWKSLKIDLQKLGIYIKERIAQYLLQCFVVLPPPAAALCKFQAKHKHILPSYVQPEGRFPPTSSSD